MSRRRSHGVITVHVSNAFKAEFLRLAQTHGVSESALALRLLEEALRADVEHQHASLLEAIVERTIRSSLSQHLHRLGELSFRAAVDSDETRRLVLTLLVKEIGAEEARQFRHEAHSASWQRLKEPV